MSSPLMKSVSGIRGIVGESFTPDLLTSVGSAFAKFAGYGTVVVGRDSRPTGEAVSMNLISVLLLAGCDLAVGERRLLSQPLRNPRGPRSACRGRIAREWCSRVHGHARASACTRTPSR